MNAQRRLVTGKKQTCLSKYICKSAAPVDREAQVPVALHLPSIAFYTVSYASTLASTLFYVCFCQIQPAGRTDLNGVRQAALFGLFHLMMVVACLCKKTQVPSVVQNCVDSSGGRHKVL